VGGSTRPAGSHPPTAGSTGAVLPAEGQRHIGVLALQGAFREHVRMLRQLGAKVTEVRLPRDLEGLDGLMIPGGESTTIGLLLEEHKLMEPLREFVKTHPVFGTCAGLIMLAKHTTDGDQPLLQVMDITVRRNAFGRQPRSFEGPVELSLGPTTGGAVPRAGGAPVHGATALTTGAAREPGDEFHGIFIRAPWVEEVGAGVEVIARCGDHIVGVRQGNMMGVAFHPELSDDTRLHEYFLQMVRAAAA
jgi:5'-phosphate synthase pdxT subunit